MLDLGYIQSTLPYPTKNIKHTTMNSNAEADTPGEQAVTGEPGVVINSISLVIGNCLISLDHHRQLSWAVVVSSKAGIFCPSSGYRICRQRKPLP